MMPRARGSHTDWWCYYGVGVRLCMWCGQVLAAFPANEEEAPLPHGLAEFCLPTGIQVGRYLEGPTRLSTHRTTIRR